MKYSYLLLAIVVGLMNVSCDKQTTTVETESGLVLEFFQKGDSSGFNENEVVLLNMTYSHDSLGEMFSTKKNGMPLPILYNKERWAQEGLFYEAISACGVGDSVTFWMIAHELFAKTFKATVPDSIKGTDKLTFTVGIEAAMTREEFESFGDETSRKMDAKIINDYIEENGLTAQKTESGLAYIITQQGEGNQPVAGNKVLVHYSGAFLDGKVFDSSEGRDPIEFILGKGAVIKGWDEGLALLNVGSKATFLIPSSLAYGKRGSRGVIPPNAILKFEVELVDVKQ